MSIDQFVTILRKALQLEEGAWGELRDNASVTALCGGLMAVVVLLGGLGAFLWGELNMEQTPDGFFVDTVILGSIFTLLLLLAWLAVTYVVLSQVYGESVAPDALFRVFAVGIVPFALGFLVIIPELNFAIGVLSVALAFNLLILGLRAAFSIERMRSIVATLAGFAVFAVVMSVLITVDNPFVNGATVFEWSEDGATKSYDVSDFNIDDFDTGDFIPEE